MKKFIENVVIIFLVIVVLFMSILLLSYNEYHVSQFGNKSLLIVNNDLLDYKKGSLLIVKKVPTKEIKADDYIFYCDMTNSEVMAVVANVRDIKPFNDGYKVILTNGIIVDSKYVIGTTKETKEIKYIGSVLRVLESKVGNFFLIVLPAGLLFIYELVSLILEYKGNKGKLINKKSKNVEN